jgi:hypothetical protein
MQSISRCKGRFFICLGALHYADFSTPRAQDPTNPTNGAGLPIASVFLIPRVRKADRELSLVLSRGPHSDSNILTESREKGDKPANGESAVAVSHQQGNLRLLHSKDLARRVLQPSGVCAFRTLPRRST